MFFVTLVVLTTLMIFIGVAREAFRQGLSPRFVLQLIPYAIPNALVFALPGTLLFSVCVVYGRMSASNEIAILQSVGIPPSVVIWPAIIVSLLISLITVCLVDIAFSWGHFGMQRVVLSAVDDVAYNVLRAEHSYSHGQFSINVQDVDGRQLLQPTITCRNANGEKMTLTADAGSMEVSPVAQGLTFSLENGVAKIGDQIAFYFPDKLQHTIKLSAAKPHDLLSESPSHLPLASMPQASLKQIQRVYKLESEIAVHTGFDIVTSRFDSLADNTAAARTNELARNQRRLHHLNAEPFRRWASGFTCLAFTVVGIPLATLLKTSDYMTTFGICFLPILVVYYPLFALGLDLSKSGAMPPYFVWMANYVIFSIGIVMMKRAIYS